VAAAPGAGGGGAAGVAKGLFASLWGRNKQLEPEYPPPQQQVWPAVQALIA
jgi:hypothetical protein